MAPSHHTHTTPHHIPHHNTPHHTTPIQSPIPDGQTEFLTPQLTVPSQKNCSLMQCPALPHFLYPSCLPPQVMRKGVTVKEIVLITEEEGERDNLSQMSISWSVDSE